MLWGILPLATTRRNEWEQERKSESEDCNLKEGEPEMESTDNKRGEKMQ